MSKRNVLQRLLGGVKSFGRALADTSGPGNGGPDNSGQGADWFGPQQPMPAQAPAEVAGRQFDYPVGYNLWQQPKVFEGRDFRSLRGLADGYDVLRLLIETRKDQMCGLPWVIKRRDPTAVGDDPRIAALESFFRCPDGINSWSRWLRMLLEDLLVIDAPTLYIQRTLGGQALAFQVMDGATIKPVIDDFGRRPAPPAPAYQQVLKGLPAVDYTADDLLYLPRNPRSHRVYGYSPVEQLEMTVNIALRRQLYQLQYYTEGNIPEALIGVPDTWNPDQIKQFQAYWDILHEGDTASRRHAKFVPGGVAKTFIPIKEPELKGVFDEWLARVACYCFSVSPQPFVAQMNRATAETAAQTAESEGNQPAKLWVKELIDGILTREFAAPDLEFIWQIPASLDPSVQATTINTYVRAGVMTLNESRNLLGLAPVADGDQPLIYTGTGVVTLHNALASGNASASAQPPSALTVRENTANGPPPPMAKGNPYHDAIGQFTTAGGAVTPAASAALAGTVASAGVMVPVAGAGMGAATLEGVLVGGRSLLATAGRLLAAGLDSPVLVAGALLVPGNAGEVADGLVPGTNDTRYRLAEGQLTVTAPDGVGGTRVIFDSVPDPQGNYRAGNGTLIAQTGPQGSLLLDPGAIVTMAQPPKSQLNPNGVSPDIKAEDLTDKTENEIRQLAKNKGLIPDAVRPDRYYDPVTGKERLRIDQGHVDVDTGNPYDIPSAAQPHVHGYGPGGKKFPIEDPANKDNHFPLSTRIK